MAQPDWTFLMAGDWTINRVVFAPQAAVDLLNDLDARIARHNSRITELLEANNRYLQDARNWHIVEQLRVGEGSSVEILCDNADFNGQPNNAVVCNGEWTDWQNARFTGDTIAAALGAALVAFTQWSRT
ncbi:hypothetical protein [Mesorhizobium neociceri]|uniref:Uncharacterized protein n=1 Tax=Mesorhizobium neociceri TaxID=1307853 RepID=A0A838B6L3_9HYPH|nr:hypothetical protein [Mesorhizobium neociceri]MBA1141717.1 hypothetical protein [Mesorhizobium neociceri]